MGERKRACGCNPGVFESRIERTEAFELAKSRDEVDQQEKIARPAGRSVMSVEIKHESLILAQNERWRRA